MFEDFIGTIECWQSECEQQHGKDKYKCAWATIEDKANRRNECKGCRLLVAWLSQNVKPPADVKEWKEGKPTY